MHKRILTITICAILGIALIYSYFFLHDYKNYKNNNIIKGIPTDVCLIIKIDDIEKITNQVKEKINYKDDLLKFSFFQKFYNTISIIDSTLENKDIYNILKHKPVSISLHPEGKDNLSPLFTYSLSNKAEQKKLINYLINENGNAWDINTRKYNSNNIYKLTHNNYKIELFFTFDNGLLIFSPSSLTVEKSIRQLDTEFSLINDDTFFRLYKTAGNSSDINLFINLSQIPQAIKSLFNTSTSKHLAFIKKMGKWGELDLNIHSNTVNINGFIYPEKEHNKLSTIFKDINPSTSKISKVIPSNCPFFISYNIDDSNKFKENFHNYLKTNNLLDNYKNRILSVTNSNSDFEKYIFNFLGDEFALLYNSSNLPNHDEAKTLIIETISKSKTLNYLEKITNIPIKPIYNYKIDSNTSYPVYKGEGLEGIQNIFAHFFPTIPTKYFCFIDNYIVFANSINTLKAVIYSNELKKTIYNSKYYQQFTENFSYKENMFVYCDFSKISSIAPNISNFELLNPGKDQKEALSNFYGVGFQITNAKELLYTNISIEHLPVREAEPRTIWQSGLDSTIFQKPTLVTNHYTNEKEILVQDKSNILYLIANNGKILWQKKLNNQILSTIYQIDYYRNNKLQYLFNTKEKIYLLDRNGNHVEKYPINLNHEATNGIALFDYDKNRNYRIFVACKDKRTYAYDKTGKILNGWKAKPTEGFISQPIQHFRLNNKDFIVFADDKKNYILNRKGKSRVSINEDFIRGANSIFYEYGSTSIITSDIEGNARIIDLNNGLTTKIDLLNNREDHYFTFTDISEKTGNEILLLTDNEATLYSEKGKKIFTKEFDGNISLTADIYQFSSNNKKIGVFDEQNQKIYLINGNGSLYKNFPLKGRSRFSIGFLSSESTQFNLIVGGDNNYLYNYRIE
ncbi:DUF3352 domain-containing protein [Plebeiibacterium marinum]|uniref:Uncharacterized protein n=1 Tax=Plebeiibacterium marinum TaxID=2992111 RepID=A0AAE3MFG6_9BACT|nr:DUF3352 domain-containing protein [Plebeiobacterium marinum]MCW3806431.1 hypothetical protein [Plebeiobacterium marinum]